MASDLAIVFGFFTGLTLIAAVSCTMSMIGLQPVAWAP